MSFIRCDRGSEAADHHTLAMTLGPRTRYVHSAYQVADLDSLAAGGEFLKDAGFNRSWGIGRHIQGSQIFDYWRDPDGILLEHYTDGDRFDASLETGRSEMTTSIISALRKSDNEFDLARLRGLLKVAQS